MTIRARRCVPASPGPIVLDSTACSRTQGPLDAHFVHLFFWTQIKLWEIPGTDTEGRLGSVTLGGSEGGENQMRPLGDDNATGNFACDHECPGVGHAQLG